MRETILNLIYESIAELNEQRGRGEQIQPSPDTSLLGDASGLDSLGFVNLVALIEEKCHARFGRDIVLSSVEGKPGERDPFESVAALAAHIETLLNRPTPTQ